MNNNHRKVDSGHVESETKGVATSTLIKSQNACSESLICQKTGKKQAIGINAVIDVQKSSAEVACVASEQFYQVEYFKFKNAQFVKEEMWLNKQISQDIKKRDERKSGNCYYNSLKFGGFSS